MYCPKCGAQLKDGAKFCGNCGAALGTSQTQVNWTSKEPKQQQQQQESHKSQARVNADGSVNFDANAQPRQQAAAQPAAATQTAAKPKKPKKKLTVGKVIRRVLAAALVIAIMVPLVKFLINRTREPEVVADQFMSSLQEGDLQSASEDMVLSGTGKLASGVLGVADGKLEDVFASATTTDGEAFYKKLKQKLFGFKYTKNGEMVVDGDNATLSVTIQSYDPSALQAALAEGMATAVDITALESQFANASDGDLGSIFSLIGTALKLDLSSVVDADALIEILDPALDSMQERTVETQAEIPLVKTSSGWKINSLDENTLNLLTGGLYSVLSQM